MLGVILLGVAACIIGAALAALNDALTLWWLRRQKPAPKPSGFEKRRVWTMACRFDQPHPAHRWRRSAWNAGHVPTSHPNWCPGCPPR